MPTFDKPSNYFSGQGVIMVGRRTAAGRPAGLVPVGNVSSLTLGFATSTLNHKESQSGQRATDLRLTTEVECSLSMVMEHFSRENLEIALRGEGSDIPAGSVANLGVGIYPGKISPLSHMKVSSVVVTLAGTSTALTPFVDDDTAWDYVVNAEAGSIKFNDGAVTAVDALASAGVDITNVADGTTPGEDLRISIALVDIPEDAAVGDVVYIGDITWGSAGAPDDGDVEGTYAISKIDRTTGYIEIKYDITGGAYASGGKVVFAGTEVDVDYAYEAQKLVDSFVGGNTERFLRFEGLNTADENRPVVVEVFRFTVDPLEELALIQDDIAGITLNGSVLSDALQTDGSRFFKVRLLR